MEGQRYIRLKEQIPLRSNELVPPPSYLNGTDGSLSNGPFKLEVDKDGFIKTGNTVSEQPRRIVVLGGSFVESSYAHESERFVAGAERRLLGQGHNVQVHNGGYSGTTALQMLNTLSTKAYPIVGSQGLVVVFGPQSDVNALRMEGGYWNSHDRYRAMVPMPAREASDIATGLDSAGRVYSAIAGVAASLGMKLIFATSPFRVGDFNTDSMLRKAYSRSRSTFESFMELRLGLSRVVREVAAATEVPLIDGDLFMGGDPEYFYDEMHLNSHGQHAFGSYFAEQLSGHLPSA